MYGGRAEGKGCAVGRAEVKIKCTAVEQKGKKVQLVEQKKKQMYGGRAEVKTNARWSSRSKNKCTMVEQK
jgi:hypothetical protein